MSKFYSGIGSRETPSDILKNMSIIAARLEDMGYTLRSGHAKGADISFAKDVKHAQIWLPFHEYNYDDRNPNHNYNIVRYDDGDAFNSIEKYHPKPSRLGGIARLLMARNYRIIVGQNEPNSEFAICWTPNGEAVGGTGQALRLCKDLGITVYNMFSWSVDDILKDIEKRNLIN